MERGDTNIGNCGYWLYTGSTDVPKTSGSIKPIDTGALDCGGRPVLDYGIQPLAEYTESHSTPRILTRAEKGQALTHLEMDFNLGSLFHKVNTSSVGAPFTPEELSTGSEESSGLDVYFERHKPTREEEREGLFATFSYAPVVNGKQTIIQNPFQTIKIQHTTDEIRYKLSNETIPGTLDIEEDFHVTGSIFTAENLSVSGNAKVENDVETRTLKVLESASIDQSFRVGGTASFDRDVYIEGNLYVNGVIFGNLSQKGYNSLENPGYAATYSRFGTVDTGSQSDARLKESVVDFYGSLEKVVNLRPVSFNWKPEAEKSGRDVGLIAQEVRDIYPEAVAEGSDGYLRIDYEKLIPLLISAVKELKAELEWARSRNQL